MPRSVKSRTGSTRTRKSSTKTRKGSTSTRKSSTRTRKSTPRRRKTKSTPRRTKRYTDRPSPPLPANHWCGAIKKGNDGKMWRSQPNYKGICSWRRV